MTMEKLIIKFSNYNYKKKTLGFKAMPRVNMTTKFPFESLKPQQVYPFRCKLKQG